VAPSDEALVAAVAAGDSVAATAFVRRFQARVFGLARSIVGDPSMAEEIAQEAFLRVWRHAEAYDHRRARVDTWLLSITRNLAIDQLRIRRATAVDPAELDRMDVILLRPSEGGEELGDELAALREALGALPADQRRALVMAALYGYTASEISEIEGTPLGTTKSRIRAALQKLRADRKVSDER
jgi:RNA polymerase sigma factor (sigma-70 family)